MKNLSMSLDKITKPLFKRRGFIENKILVDWEKIVGASLSLYSSPRKLAFRKNKTTDGVLHVEVYDSSMATEMMYMEPVLIEKIACYFGYKAVAKFKLIQKPGGIKTEEVQTNDKPIEISKEQQGHLNDYLDGLDDEEMRSALLSLGAGVISSSQTQ